MSTDFAADPPISAAADYNANHPFRTQLCTSYHGWRLDQIVATLLPQYSRGRWQAAIAEGKIAVNGRVVTANKQKLVSGDWLDIDPIEELLAAAQGRVEAENLPLTIVFEDESLIVINKPAGLVTHPGAGNWQGTLQNALLHHCPALAALPRAGIVHRLDKDTSGLLVVAKTPTAQLSLVRQLQAKTVRREYLALVHGSPPAEGRVDAAIGRDRHHRTRMAVVSPTHVAALSATEAVSPPRGKSALTYFTCLERFATPGNGTALLCCRLATGRTHQIRVHMTSIGHPLVGDAVYGKGRSVPPVFHRQALHAAQLSLDHPAQQTPMCWRCDLPDDLAKLIETCRCHSIVRAT